MATDAATEAATEAATDAARAQAAYSDELAQVRSLEPVAEPADPEPATGLPMPSPLVLLVAGIVGILAMRPRRAG
ncbi:MAG: hypothetical protein AAF675_01340 [Pseudomonadota bacterium]